jgi:hypothetical protein
MPVTGQTLILSGPSGCLHSRGHNGEGGTDVGQPAFAVHFRMKNADGRLHVHLRLLQLPADPEVTPSNRSHVPVTQSPHPLKRLEVHLSATLQPVRCRPTTE